MGKAVSLPYLVRVIAVVLFASFTILAEDFPTWKHKGEILLDASPGGAGITGGLGGFPLLVRLTAAEFRFADARGDGGDLRFTTHEGKVLPHEIERWDSAAGRAEIWVRLDTIPVSVGPISFRIHWGKLEAASTSDGPAVFQSAAGHIGVWHLGKSGLRPNAVAGGFPATPHFVVNTGPGPVALADSMDGGDSYLNLDDGYADFTGGFSFSAWIKPYCAGEPVHILYLGNGAGSEEFFLQIDGNGRDLTIGSSAGGDFRIRAPDFIEDLRWQQVAVTVQGTTMKLFRNGASWGTTTLPAPLTNLKRVSNYLGGSPWEPFGSYRGAMDEARIARVAHGPDWIRLAYATQNPDGKVVSLRLSVPCISRFAIPADTSVPEGGVIDLAGIADCAEQWFWSSLTASAPRLLDPEVKILTLRAPRVQGDMVLVYRFTAIFAGQAKIRDISLRVEETLPDPAFNLPPLIFWGGLDSLFLPASLTNAMELLDAGSPPVKSTWALAGPAMDTAWRANGLWVMPTREKHSLLATLCMENGGGRRNARPRWSASGPPQGWLGGLLRRDRNGKPFRGICWEGTIGNGDQVLYPFGTFPEYESRRDYRSRHRNDRIDLAEMYSAAALPPPL